MAIMSFVVFSFGLLLLLVFSKHGIKSGELHTQTRFCYACYKQCCDTVS